MPTAEVYNPDKTSIGRIERGFDFLGYRFGREGLTLAAKTIEQFAARAIRLTRKSRGRLAPPPGVEAAAHN